MTGTTGGSSPSDPAGTRAAVLARLREPLELRRLALPALKPGQVLVEVAFTGVCHTQVLEARGHRGEDRWLPHTLGHEGSGTVAAVGSGVTKVKAGDRVVLTWIKGLGADVPSAQYGAGGAVVHSGAISTFLERAVVSENRVVPVAPDMPLREAALLGCAVPTGAGAVLNTARPRPGSSVAVFGAGGVGLCAIMAAALVHADPVIAVDVVPAKLAKAKAMGATHTVDASREDPVVAIRGITGGRGAEHAIEAAGRRETMEAAFRAVREGGGQLVIAGNLPHGATMSLDPMDLIRGRRILGTWGGETAPDRDIPAYARLFIAGKLPLAELLSHEYTLDEVNTALDALEAGKVARALLRIGGP